MATARLDLLRRGDGRCEGGRRPGTKAGTVNLPPAPLPLQPTPANARRATARSAPNGRRRVDSVKPRGYAHGGDGTREACRTTRESTPRDRERAGLHGARTPLRRRRRSGPPGGPRNQDATARDPGHGDPRRPSPPIRNPLPGRLHDERGGAGARRPWRSTAGSTEPIPDPIDDLIRATTTSIRMSPAGRLPAGPRTPQDAHRLPVGSNARSISRQRGGRRHPARGRSRARRPATHRDEPITARRRARADAPGRAHGDGRGRRSVAGEDSLRRREWEVLLERARRGDGRHRRRANR